MASFLALCARVAARSGVFEAPSTVIGQTGRKAKCVDWVMHAWELIQNSSADWSFLHGEVSAVALTVNDMDYSATNLGVTTRFGEWKGDRFISTGRLYRPWTIYDHSIGVTDEVPLHEVPYDYWRDTYDRKSHDASRPIVYAIAPDQSIRFGPKPNAAYRVRGEFRKAPQTLAADADIPDMPLRFHDIIVYRAILLANEADEAPQGIAYADREYHRLLADLQRDCLAPITVGGSGPIA